VWTGGGKVWRGERCLLPSLSPAGKASLLCFAPSARHRHMVGAAALYSNSESGGGVKNGGADAQRRRARATGAPRGPPNAGPVHAA
jgi:hypothetical protein